MNTNRQTQEIVRTALGVAIVFVATMVIKIPNAMQGYVNLGDGFILLFASCMRPSLAFLIGGVGSGLADIAGGYGYYFLFTLIIKGLEGLIVSAWIQKNNGSVSRYLAYIVGSIIMIAGYFVADSIVNQSVILGLASVWGNIFQAGMGLIISVIGYPVLQKLLHMQMHKPA